MKIFENGKIIFFRDDVCVETSSSNKKYSFNPDPDGELHMAKLSTRKNSAVKGQWIENGITGKYAYLYKVIVGERNFS